MGARSGSGQGAGEVRPGGLSPHLLPPAPALPPRTAPTHLPRPSSTGSPLMPWSSLRRSGEMSQEGASRASASSFACTAAACAAGMLLVPEPLPLPARPRVDTDRLGPAAKGLKTVACSVAREGWPRSSVKQQKIAKPGGGRRRHGTRSALEACTARTVACPLLCCSVGVGEPASPMLGKLADPESASVPLPVAADLRWRRRRTSAYPPPRSTAARERGGAGVGRVAPHHARATGPQPSGPAAPPGPASRAAPATAPRVAPTITPVSVPPPPESSLVPGTHPSTATPVAGSQGGSTTLKSEPGRPSPFTSGGVLGSCARVAQQRVSLQRCAVGAPGLAARRASAAPRGSEQTHRAAEELVAGADLHY